MGIWNEKRCNRALVVDTVLCKHLGLFDLYFYLYINKNISKIVCDSGDQTNNTIPEAEIYNLLKNSKNWNTFLFKNGWCAD